MTTAWMIVIANIPAICCVATAAVLNWFDKPGWGWFLFIGLLLTHFAKSSKQESEATNGEG